MAGLSEKYTNILSEIEKKISNPEEKKFVVKKVEEISFLYMELIDRITKLDSDRLDDLEDKQEKMVGTLSKVQESVNLIKSDIYEDDNYDFEIVCPYCNHEFVADIDSELKEEIECPECHNIIELDWDENEKDECPHSCEGCHNKKENNNTNDSQEDNGDEQSNNQNDNQENDQPKKDNNEDDM